MKIAVIEDDKEINKLISELLISNGYECISAYTGIEGSKILENHDIDLAIIDIMLPYKNGDLILKDFREISNKPVIIVSAKDLVHTKVDLLRLGADDYLSKPFDTTELLARVESVLRRTNRNKYLEESVLTFQEVTLNSYTKEVNVNEIAIDLTYTEFQLLKVLLESPTRVFSKKMLHELLWDNDCSIEDNTINVHISRLRGKMKFAQPNKDYIKTLWGLGYRLDSN